MDSIVIIQIILTGVVTYLCAKPSFMNPIRSSAIVGICVSLIIPTHATILYGATFVGMCSHKKFKITDIIISSLFYYVIVYFLTQWFKGIGGTLGISAFLGVLLWQIIKNLSKKLRART